jgi:hypothetical protein
MFHALKLVTAVVFLLVGIAGLVLPVLQGFLFIAAGLLLLADYIPWLATHLRRIERSDPRLARLTDSAHRKLDAIFERPWLVVLALTLALGMTGWGMYILLR